jgi:outer membrane lipoprotein-sorting protein
MRKGIYFIFFIFIASGFVAIYAEDYLTPSEYLDKVSKKFGSLNDFEAQLKLTDNVNNDEMTGNLIYKNPNRIRIDFSKPASQVLVSDGQQLYVYIPMYSYILEQRLRRKSKDTILLMARNQELSTLKSLYSVAYAVGPQPVPLDEGSPERVIKLKFFSSSASYRQLEIAFTADAGLMRRVTGIIGGKTIVLDLMGMRVNKNIPDNRFKYNPPSNANVYRDFLFEVIE